MTLVWLLGRRLRKERMSFESLVGRVVLGLFLDGLCGLETSIGWWMDRLRVG
jgi:hypothetical protein